LHLFDRVDEICPFFEIPGQIVAKIVVHLQKVILQHHHVLIALPCVGRVEQQLLEEVLIHLALCVVLNLHDPLAIAELSERFVPEGALMSLTIAVPHGLAAACPPITS